MYALRYSTAALKELRKAPADVAARIRSRLAELALSPFSSPNVKKLGALPGYRLRVGNWRVIYILEQDALVIQVIRVARREEVYAR